MKRTLTLPGTAAGLVPRAPVNDGADSLRCNKMQAKSREWALRCLRRPLLTAC